MKATPSSSSPARPWTGSTRFTQCGDGCSRRRERGRGRSRSPHERSEMRGTIPGFGYPGYLLAAEKFFYGRNNSLPASHYELFELFFREQMPINQKILVEF